jgi:chromosome segregation ATPase
MSDPEVLNLLRSIDGRLGGVESRLGGVESRLGGVEARLDAVETRLETLETVTARAPDLRLLGHQMATLIERVTGLEASNTRAIAALNDIARESVTPGEVEALHSEMKELRNAKFNHEVRIRQLEAELHIAPST